MSRRRRGIEREFVSLYVVCVCGIKLGRVLKQPWPEGRQYLVPKPLEFRDVPEPTDETGKVARRCPECGAEFQRRWDKLRAMLDEMETRGVKSARLTP